VSLATDQFTCASGTWVLAANAPFYRTDSSQIRLFDVTASTGLRYGTPIWVNNDAGGSSGLSFLYHTFANTSSNTYRIEYQVLTTRATDGLGRAAGFTGNEEVYTQVSLQKIR
jgi:hypothetical protein